MTPTRFDDPGALADPNSLGRLLGPVRAVARVPLAAPGFSGASLERLTVTLADGATRSLVLKTVRPGRDWTARLTGDTQGREALVLENPAFAEVWSAFACPYLAWARSAETVALLMEDLSPHLLPDAREPVRAEIEARLLGALASLHARYWNAAPEAGLGAAARLAGILSQAGAVAELSVTPDSPLFRRVAEGWRIAESRLSPRAWALMRDTEEVFTAQAEGLPATMIHGDSKVANFAPLPDGRVAAFDWAVATRGPVALELGYYLAINATRLAGTRDEALTSYRASLEAARGEAIAAEEWTRTVALTNFSSAALMLWSKAHALMAGTAGAAEQWDWYVAELDRLAEMWG